MNDIDADRLEKSVLNINTSALMGRGIFLKKGVRPWHWHKLVRNI